MYQSKIFIRRLNKQAIKKRFLIFLENHKKVRCSFLRRDVFLDKLPKAILERQDAHERLRCFFIGIDILRHSSNVKISIKNKKKCFDIFGLSAEKNTMIHVHLREERDEKNNRKVFLISNIFKKSLLPIAAGDKACEFFCPARNDYQDALRVRPNLTGGLKCNPIVTKKYFSCKCRQLISFGSATND